MGRDSAVDALIGLIIGVIGAAVVLKIVDDATKEKRYVCPKCGQTLRRGLTHCPHCGIELRWA